MAAACLAGEAAPGRPESPALERLDYKLRFYEALLTHCDALHAQGQRLIICGDYNTAHRPIDLARPERNQKTSGFLIEEREWVDHYLAHGFVDTFRALHPEAGGARRFCEALQERGLLCKGTHKHVIRLAPPLVITQDESDWALEQIEAVLCFEEGVVASARDGDVGVGELDEMIARAGARGVRRMLTICTKLRTAPEVRAIAEGVTEEK